MVISSLGNSKSSCISPSVHEDQHNEDASECGMIFDFLAIDTIQSLDDDTIPILVASLIHYKELLCRRKYYCILAAKRSFWEDIIEIAHKIMYVSKEDIVLAESIDSAVKELRDKEL